jgi:hypothetical protein
MQQGPLERASHPDVPDVTDLFRFAHPYRRHRQNRLLRISIESEREEEARIANWLALGAYALKSPVQALSEDEESV